MVQTKEEKNEYMRLYYLKNKEKEKERVRLYNLNNQDKRKEYRSENKEKRKEYQKKYQQTPSGIKSRKIGDWKRRDGGVLDHFNDNYETIYRIYQSTKFCDECGFQLNIGDNRMRKCLDHEHYCGYFRGVVCHSCNVRKR